MNVNEKGWMNLKELRKRYQGNCYHGFLGHEYYYHIISIKEPGRGYSGKYRLYYDYIMVDDDGAHLKHILTHVSPKAIVDAIEMGTKRIQKNIFYNVKNNVVTVESYE